MTDSARTANAGVHVVGLLVERNLGWLFREQPTNDYGIDAHIETVADRPTGRLLGLQIRSGKSYLDERTEQGIVFRPSPRHVEYWLSHSLPVLAVVVDVDAQQAWWQVVSRESLVRTSGGGWKMFIPDHHLLTSDSVDSLMELADADPYVLRLRQLQLAKPLMTLLDSGGRVTLDMEEWINKSSGRASLIITGYDSDNGEVDRREWPWFFFPFANYAVELPRLFPWADLSVDEETYEDAGGRDVENALYAYEDDGEIARWRLDLALSELGRAFLVLDRELEQGLLPLA